MAGIKVEMKNNSVAVKMVFKNAKERGLLACGSNAEEHAKDLCPVDTGRLRNSITHQMPDENTVDIGTNVEYAPYVELGTGNYCTLGNGTTKTSWVYKGEDGQWHMGYPQKARPFLEPAVSEHTNEWKQLLTDSFKNG